MVLEGKGRSPRWKSVGKSSAGETQEIETKNIVIARQRADRTAIREIRRENNRQQY